MKLSLLFVYINFLIISFSLIYSIYLLLKKNIGYKQKYFFVYLFFVFITEVLGYFLRKTFGINYFFFYYPGVILNVLYFGCFFYLEFRSLILKRLAFFLTIISLGAILLFQYYDGTLMISSNVYLIVVFFDLILALIWFYQIINNIDDIFITHKQAFWVSIALIFWNVCGLLRYIPLYSLFEVDREFLRLINIIFSVVNIITYLLYLKGLKCTVYNVLRNFNYLKK